MADAPFTIVEALYSGLTQLNFIGPHTIFSRIPGVEVIVASEAGADREQRPAHLRRDEAHGRYRAPSPVASRRQT